MHIHVHACQPRVRIAWRFGPVEQDFGWSGAAFLDEIAPYKALRPHVSRLLGPKTMLCVVLKGFGGPKDRVTWVLWGNCEPDYVFLGHVEPLS